MRRSVSQFGIASGMAVSIGFWPHALFLLFIVLFKARDILPVFLFFTVMARLLGEWFFWGRIFPSRMNSGENRTDWHMHIKDLIFSKQATIQSILAAISDLFVDVILVCMALRVAPSGLVFLIFSLGQVVGAPIHGVVTQLFNGRLLCLFSMIVASAAVLVGLAVSGVTFEQIYLQSSYLSQFSPSSTMLFLLGVKVLLTGISVVTRATVAEEIKLGTMLKLQEVNE